MIPTERPKLNTISARLPGTWLAQWDLQAEIARLPAEQNAPVPQSPNASTEPSEKSARQSRRWDNTCARGSRLDISVPTTRTRIARSPGNFEYGGFLLRHHFLIFSCLGRNMSRCDAECPALIADLHQLKMESAEPNKKPQHKASGVTK